MSLFPPIEPHATGMLGVPGAELFWETSGNPRGIPALYLHGGPGAGLLSGHRRRFCPETFRIVAFDQRGAGRSLPRADESAELLATCDFRTFVRDIEALRVHLGVDAWLLHGVSFGASLALAYATSHPHRVLGVVGMALSTTRASDVDWMTEGVGKLFPEAWAELSEAAPRPPGTRLVEAYRALLASPDPNVRERAARSWVAWEEAHVSLGGKGGDPRFADPRFRATFATLVCHVFAELGEAFPMGDLARVSHLPTVLVHGRLDVSSPVGVPFEVARRWGPRCELQVVEDEGHGGPKMVDACARAIARLASTHLLEPRLTGPTSP
ncbi:MAG: alpha/beta fold hydrolase [Myxococcales bacterium]|nr:alpha/beta fold hydrolase [Myxococcales bacterium]